jgi:hypothetical protein
MGHVLGGHIQENEPIVGVAVKLVRRQACLEADPLLMRNVVVLRV